MILLLAPKQQGPLSHPPWGSQVGDLALDFELPTLSGGMVSQEQLRASGRPFLLYFFAIW